MREQIISAITSGSSDQLAQVCTEEPSRAHEADEAGWTPLMLACAYGNAAQVRTLLEFGASPKQKSTAMVRADRPRESRVFVASSTMFFFLPEATEYLPCGARFDKGTTVVHAAAASGSVDVLELLFSAKARPHTRDDAGLLPVHLAAQAGHLEAAKLLTSQKGKWDVDTPSRIVTSLRAFDVGYTPLMAALECGNLTLVELHRALIHDHSQIALMLLEKGPDCSLEDQHGNNPLHKLHLRHEPLAELIQKMIACGANPHQQNKFGVATATWQEELPELGPLFAETPPPADGGIRLPFQDPTESKVLQNVDEDYAWQDLHQALWEELVPPSGQCGTVQGELVRTIGRLSDEAYRNGNANWDASYKKMATWMGQTLLEDRALSSEAKQALARDVKSISRRVGAEIGPDSAYARVAKAVVDWCVRQPALLPREHDPEISR